MNLDEYVKQNDNFLDEDITLSSHYMTDEDYKELGELIKKATEKGNEERENNGN